MGGQKTSKNLMEAFAGESQVNRKYLAYSKKAEAEAEGNIEKSIPGKCSICGVSGLKFIKY
jgi:rubrerythrin